MQSRPAARYSSVIDVLERVLDKGIVIDAWVRVSLADIDLLGRHTRVVIASVTTYDQPSGTRAVIPHGSLRPGVAARRTTDMS